MSLTVLHRASTLQFERVRAVSTILRTSKHYYQIVLPFVPFFNWDHLIHAAKV